MKAKKIIALLLILVLTVNVMACGKKSKKNNVSVSKVKSLEDAVEIFKEYRTGSFELGLKANLDIDNKKREVKVPFENVKLDLVLGGSRDNADFSIDKFNENINIDDEEFEGELKSPLVIKDNVIYLNLDNILNSTLDSDFELGSLAFSLPDDFRLSDVIKYAEDNWDIVSEALDALFSEMEAEEGKKKYSVTLKKPSQLKKGAEAMVDYLAENSDSLLDAGIDGVDVLRAEWEDYFVDTVDEYYDPLMQIAEVLVDAFKIKDSNINEIRQKSRFFEKLAEQGGKNMEEYVDHLETFLNAYDEEKLSKRISMNKEGFVKKIADLDIRKYEPVLTIEVSEDSYDINLKLEGSDNGIDVDAEIYFSFKTGKTEIEKPKNAAGIKEIADNFEEEKDKIEEKAGELSDSAKKMLDKLDISVKEMFENKLAFIKDNFHCLYLSEYSIIENVMRYLIRARKDEYSAQLPSDTPDKPATPTPEPTKEPEPVKNGSVVVWTWDDSFAGMVNDSVIPNHPELSGKIDVYNLGGSDEYKQALKDYLKYGKNKTGLPDPDIVLLEVDYIRNYIDSGALIDTKALGITELDMDSQYAYTKQLGTSSDGKIYAVSWQACPGALTIKADLAKQYLGTDDPEELQEMLSTWDKVLESARTVNEKSGGKVKLFAGIDELSRLFFNSVKNGLYDKNTGKLRFDPSFETYAGLARKMYDERLTFDTADTESMQWTAEWEKFREGSDQNGREALCYAGATWFSSFMIYDRWNNNTILVKGPQNYFWGGSFMAVTKNCQNTTTAGELIKAVTCDDNVMKSHEEITGELANNRRFNKDYTINSKKMYSQNVIKVYAELAENINADMIVPEYEDLRECLNKCVYAYAKGKITSIDGLMNEYFSQAKILFPYLN